MPSRPCSSLSPSRRTRALSADPAPGFPTRAMHHSCYTTRRSGQENGRSYYEVIETREEVSTRTIPANQAPTLAAPSPSHQQQWPNGTGGALRERNGDALRRHSRLVYHGNGRAPRMHRSISKSGGGSARRAPLLISVDRGPASRHVSVTDQEDTTPRGIESFSSATRRHANGRRSPRASRMAESPVDISMLEDYKTPARRRRADGHYAYDHGMGHLAATCAGRGSRHSRRSPLKDLRAYGSNDVEEVKNSLSSAAPAGPYHFRVRLHECQGVFADLEGSGRAPPAVYFAVHTVEERGHSGVADKACHKPVFHDEFMFSSADPEHDALVCTLVAVSSVNRSQGSRVRRDKKVAECVLALHNLAWQEERKVWVPLVRHPGTSRAYEQGEVLVSIYSDDFGYDDVATEEEEAACSAAIHDTLARYAPQELHRLDWMTAAYVNKGSEALSQLRASYQARTVEPVPVRVTVQRIDGLTDEAGCPARASDVYVVVGDGRVEWQSKTVAYRRRAIIDQEFNFIMRNPEVDTLSVTVFGNNRKLGETVVGLTNVQAGKAKEVTLMLVRAAETGDASNGGQVTITLQADKYSSPHQMSATQETRLRERILGYLWCYLRDDLHRLDAIVGNIDNEEVHMQTWARTVGPEQKPRRITMSVRGARNILANGGLLPQCYARISVGPTTVRTGLSTARNGAVTFNDSFRVPVYDPAHDAVEVMMIVVGDDGEREMSRVCFGVATLPRQRPVVRTLRLVAAATRRDAHIQGELTVELVAEDFGLTGALAQAAAANTSFASSVHMQRLESIVQRSSPDKLHRVPYILDTALPGEAERVIEEQAKQYGGDVAVAPMTVKILGVKEFKPVADFYVKVYLNKDPILRTADVRASAEVALDIDDNNERTMRLKDAAQAIMTFKIAQHRTLRKTVVLGETEVALSNLVRGEKNVLWLPFFAPSQEPVSGSGGGGLRGSASCTSDREENALKVKGNRMPNSNGTAVVRPQPQSRGAALARRGAAATSPVGLLGVELQSNAFLATTVTEYKLDNESGRKGVSAPEAVTYDVTSLIAKMRPSELPKVQPMIAHCSSLKSAHDELRAELSPFPIAATVYVNIDSVDLATEMGKRQEAEGGIAVEIIYGSERQESRKRTEFAHDALHHRQMYTQIRLDIPEKHHSAISRAAADAKGVPALVLRLVGGFTSDCAAGAASSKTEGVVSGGAFVEDDGGANHNGLTEAFSDTTEDSYYVGGENNIKTYIKFPKNRDRLCSSKPPGKERLGQSSMMSTAPQQSCVWVQEGQQQYPHRAGGNNIGSYVDSSERSRWQSAVRAERAPSRQQSRLASASGRKHEPGSTSTSSTAVSLPHNWSALYRGEIGVVCLSLRALLTKPLHKIGDTIRVPIVAPAIQTATAYRARCSPEVNQCCIVGHVTLRLTLPAFENIPESLRLSTHRTISRVESNYVRYYERRIGAYLRSHNAPALVSLHYNFYEREVASGRWPASLRDWMQALINQFGPETENFGSEPLLPFDLEEWKGARQCYEADRAEGKAALAPSERGSRRAGKAPDDRHRLSSSRGESLSAHSRADSTRRRAAKDQKKRSSMNRRLDAATTGAESVHSF
ncbi:hypothetical protein JIQ42_00473 [Leishmania sp. Namibia]|uniref:hypothetical protein n=1 Tax=Leishmania sp. Namibia TaxID=2802991 RepID=UPI001B745C98|nr:hypothetical protein JIQ42_00473 [Leishmania sp. Namibia]